MEVQKRTNQHILNKKYSIVFEVIDNFNLEKRKKRKQ